MEFETEYALLALLNGSISPAFSGFSSSVRQIQTHQLNGMLSIADSVAGLSLHIIQSPENKYVGVFSGEYTTGHKKLLFPIVSWTLYRNLGESTPSSG